MKNYVISRDDYMGEGSDIFKVQAKDLIGALGGLFGTKESMEADENVGPLTDKEYIKLCKDANGDGMPYYLIFCVEDNKKVFG